MKILKSGRKNRVWGTKTVFFGKTKRTTLISMKKRTRRAPENWKSQKKLKSDEP